MDTAGTVKERVMAATHPKIVEADSLIGKRIPKMDAPDKASGRTRYIHDLNLPGQLHAKILRSTQVHARIVSINTEAARSLPGVHAVITAADVPWQRPIGVTKDHMPLKGDRVRSQRDEIAAVAADSVEIAEQALALIRVVYEPLPVVSSAAEALAPGAPLLHGEDLMVQGPRGQRAVVHPASKDNIALVHEYAQGDVAEGERASAAIVEDVFRLHYVTHCCLGVSGVIAEFDPSGNLLLYSNTQVPFLHKREFAELLGIDAGRVRIIQPPIGG
jgi:xanthine dehydrogenase molybdenum-binding subunit